MGLGQDSARAGYQISQRADFFETEVGLETTIRRPIINTRDEPHATADKYRRLHVIIGDANLSQASNFLKFGTTAMVLSLIEAGLAPRIEVHEPVAALQAVSHDTSLTGLLRLGDGRRISALDLQWIYFEAASKHAQDTGVADAVDGDGHTHEVLERWSATLSELGGDRAAAASSVEWLAKLSLLEGYRQRDGLGWDNARLGLVDLQWADIRPEKGLYYRLLARDRMQPNRRRRRDRPCGDRTAVGHAGVLPRALRQQVRCRPRGGQLGLGDLRCPRPRQAPAGPNPRAAARDRSPHRRPVCPAQGGRDVPGRTARTQPRFLKTKPPAGAPGVALLLTGCPLGEKGRT